MKKGKTLNGFGNKSQIHKTVSGLSNWKLRMKIQIYNF